MQTFIRREVAALEAQGLDSPPVRRATVSGKLTDAADLAEQEQTCYLLDAGPLGLTRALIADAIGAP